MVEKVGHAGRTASPDYAALPQQVLEVLDCWFGAPGTPEFGSARKCWFSRDQAFDTMLRQRFGTLIDAASEMAEDLIRYDILAQEALRGVMRKVLMEVSRTGLPGNHHFFITFLTGAPGVRISTRLRERYPEQMTIVLQYQYWDLKVTDTGFEVGLSFSDIPEKLEIPFAAVRGFYDPSVNFELEFDVKAEQPDAEAEAPATPAPVALTPEKKTAGAKKAAEAEKSEDGEVSPAKGADVVSLDAFRKK